MLADRFLDRLAQLGPVRRDEPMSRHTTFQVGGPVLAYLAAPDCATLRAAALLAREWETPLLIIGAGSNLLVSDAGVRALVIETWANGESLGPLQECDDGALAWVFAGMPLPRLAHQAAAAGLGGAEWAVGIPGTVGGAAVNNAGAHGGDMAGLLHSLRLLQHGEERVVPAADLEMAYRTTRLRREADADAGDTAVVLGARLRFQRRRAGELQAHIAEYVAHRRATQPGQRSVGSIFKNPPGHASGWLIEQAGLKGLRIGDAEVSPKHGNFIVNRGRARAADVCELIQRIQEKIRETFGITLELEIQKVGEF